jgi:hypothetical protein
MSGVSRGNRTPQRMTKYRKTGLFDGGLKGWVDGFVKLE